MEVQGLKRRLEEQQNQQRWRSLQLAAEEAVREDEAQLDALQPRASLLGARGSRAGEEHQDAAEEEAARVGRKARAAGSVDAA